MKVVDARNSIAPVAETTAPITRSLFPVDAQAVIYKPARSTMMSAPKRKEEWRLQFERRTPLRIEPLMGWTADDDPLHCGWFAIGRSIGSAGRKQGCGRTPTD
jgi:ETC complex I subunit conserved region